MLTGLLGRDPYAVQTMIYFKPPGARGQALHQDNYYLRVQPGTCIAAWMALDACDTANGCLQVVPGSHKWPILCTVPADTTQSFSDVTVPIPIGTPVVSIRMNPGDVLFSWRAGAWFAAKHNNRPVPPFTCGALHRGRFRTGCALV